MLLNKLNAHIMCSKPQDEEWSRSAIELLACSVLVGHDRHASGTLITSDSANSNVNLGDLDGYHTIHHLLSESSAIQHPTGTQGAKIDSAMPRFAHRHSGLPIDDHPMFRPEWATLSVFDSSVGTAISSVTINVHCLLPEVKISVTIYRQFPPDCFEI